MPDFQFFFSLKVWKSDALVLVVFVRNKTERVMSGVVTRLNLPPEFQKIPLIGISESMEDVFTDTLGPRVTRQHIVSVSCKAVSSGIGIRGQTSYTDPSLTVGNAFFNVSLAASDFLRPLEITTEDFGRLWENHTAERKQRFMSASIKSPEQLAELLVSRLHIHAVQIIGMEVILAGRVLVFSNELCLVHAQLLGSQQLDITIHTQRPPYSEAIIRNCASIFSQ
jgi:AP-4 complex subunit epsilon-1